MIGVSITSVSPLKKVTREAAALPALSKVCGKTHFFLKTASRIFLSPLKKRVGGRIGGTGGRKRPLRASRDRRRPQAVPVATKEATGIDSRDKGVSFPPEEQI